MTEERAYSWKPARLLVGTLAIIALFGYLFWPVSDTPSKDDVGIQRVQSGSGSNRVESLLEPVVFIQLKERLINGSPGFNPAGHKEGYPTSLSSRQLVLLGQVNSDAHVSKDIVSDDTTLALFNTDSNRAYVVESSTDDGKTWQPVSEEFVGSKTGGTMTIDVKVGLVPRRVLVVKQLSGFVIWAPVNGIMSGTLSNVAYVGYANFRKSAPEGWGWRGIPEVRNWSVHDIENRGVAVTWLNSFFVAGSQEEIRKKGIAGPPPGMPAEYMNQPFRFALFVNDEKLFHQPVALWVRGFKS